mmetsp:Transcript_40084/g.113552  ORF Transcript_40084/g.113552 Transcript_40084/m.113552 type:complete len:467 (-) Transcript_40084:261-1661(-)
MATTCAIRGAACRPARRVGGAVSIARSLRSGAALLPAVPLPAQPFVVRRAAAPRASRALTVSTRAAATAAGTADAADQPKQGGMGLMVKKMAVSVAKALISLLPGRLGLTWLAGLLPTKVKDVFLSLFDNYVCEMMKAVGEKKKAEAVAMIVFKDMCKTYAEQMFIPYKFPSYHQAMHEPTDYYKMGQQYIGCLIDFDRSILMHPDRWTQVQNCLDAGENVVLFANHQSEGDAAFIPLMTEVTHPGLGEKVIYVAGDRVVSDKLAKPFSMGRNLLCVHSKKHIMDDPSTRSEKMRQNVKTLKEIERLLRQGGALIWIAPSGGRDRWAEDGSLPPAKFDPAAVEMMVKLGTKKGTQRTHFIPMAMSTAEIMPPPRSTEKELGETRVVHFTGAGLALAEEVDVSPDGPWAQGVDVSDKAAAGEALATYMYDRVCEVYEPIAACNNPNGGEVPLPENSIRPTKPAIVPR